MSQRWTEEEDEFLLCYHGIGPDFIASHDLGRPVNTRSGSRRLRHLTKTGAQAAYAKMMLAKIDFQVKAGHLSATAAEIGKRHWLRELETLLSQKGKT